MDRKAKRLRLAVWLCGEGVLARCLRAYSHKQCRLGRGAEFGKERLPNFQLGDVVRAPAAAEKLDDDGTESEQVGRGDEAVVQIARA